ncbi:unnamed protein product [Urochloa decumbens]|uniref:Uncharacterized protein n=1 Tax=Urochloa decumbens TaxID=240449 RepID=A0ABC9C265_9POAL
MLRSISRLSAHASFSARTTPPVIARASAARYLSTFPCSSAAAKASWSTTGLPSSIIKQNKSAFVDSLGGVKQTCSTGTSKKPERSWEAKLADWRARFDAWLLPNIEPTGADDLATSVWKVGLLSAFTAAALVPWPSDVRKSGNKGLNAHCSTCKCLSAPSKSKRCKTASCK